jgi:hypothetical protein
LPILASVRAAIPVKLWPGFHELQIDIGRELEHGERLVEHLAVLSRRDQDRLEVLALTQRVHERRHLDHFWSGSDHDCDVRAGHDTNLNGSWSAFARSSASSS